MNFRYFGKPYKSEKERSAYNKALKEERIKQLKINATKRARAMNQPASRGSGFMGGFQSLANIGANVNSNLERESGWGSPFGMQQPKERSVVRKRIHRRRPSRQRYSGRPIIIYR